MVHDACRTEDNAHFQEGKRSQPLVTVMMASFNHERYVGEAIRSVLAQGYSPLEFIVVDDGSQDGSRKVIEEAIHDSPLPVTFVCKENGGQASAYNTAWPHVHGELVCFIDSDDVWHVSKVERMVMFWNEYPGGALYQHQVLKGEGVCRPHLVSGDMLEYWRQRGDILNLATHGSVLNCFVPSVGLMFPRTVLSRLFPLPDSLIVCPDGYMTRTACALGPLYSHHESLARWREHEWNAGKKERFGFYAYWLPVVMPAINAFYEAQGVPLRLVYDTSTWRARMCDIKVRIHNWFRRT